MLILVIIVYALLAIFELKPLYKQKNRRDFWTNAVIGFFSFAIAILLCLDVKIPSPAKPIQDLVTSIFGK
jgi:hypothetical protein